MFEKEIKAIYHLNAEKIEGLGAFATFDQLKKIELHPAILRYISAEIDYLIYEDRQKLLKDSVFDYSGETIQHHFSMIDKEIKSRKRFSIEYIKKLILHASSFNVNYLVRPKWSLLRIIFEEETRKTTEEIIQILNYVYYYDYLKKIITSYLKKKRIHSINVHDFEEILDKIDQLEVESYLDTIYDRALSAMAEFFDTGGLTAGRIPLKAMEIFLDEKNLTEPLQYFRDYLPGSGNQYFDPQDLKRILKGDFEGFGVEEKRGEGTKPAPEPEHVPINSGENSEEEKTDVIDDRLSKYSFTFEEMQERETEQTEAEPESESVKESVSNESVSPDVNHAMDLFKNDTGKGRNNFDINFEDEVHELEQENVESLKEEIINAEADNQPPEASGQNSVETEKKPEIFTINSKNEVSQPETGETEPQISEKQTRHELHNGMVLTEFLENKNINRIVDAVFDSDMEFFLHTTDLISGASNQEEAFDILERVFKSNYVNPASKEAQEFKAIISEYFQVKQ